jgi:hypothetical protein
MSGADAEIYFPSLRLIPLFALSSFLHSQDSITENWLETCYKAYSSTGYMFEKYNAFEMGIGGGGGEYTPQIGFGWSNGVALVMLNTSSFKKSSDDESDGGLSTTNAILLSVGIVAAVGLLAGAIYYFVFRRPKKSSNGLLGDNL